MSAYDDGMKLASIVSFLLLFSGCGMLGQLIAGRQATTLRASNPLSSGATLRADAPPNHVEVRSVATPELCDRWPVADQYVLSVDEHRVCATVLRMTDKAYGELREPSSWRTLPIEAGRTAKIPLTAVQDREVATCGGSSNSIEVWSRRYEGCIANDGLITATTAKVVVDGDVTWKLEADQASR